MEAAAFVRLDAWLTWVRGWQVGGQMQLHYFSVSDTRVLLNLRDTYIRKRYGLWMPAVPDRGLLLSHSRPACLLDAKRAFPRHRGLFVLWAQQYP